MHTDAALAAKLSFVHPALMTVSLVLAARALQIGLKMRDQRQRRPPARAGEESPHRTKHGHAARAALWIGLVGFCAGPASAVYVRGFAALSTIHGWISVGTAVAALMVAFAGKHIERAGTKKSGVVHGHGALAMLTLLAAAVAAVTGIELLP